MASLPIFIRVTYCLLALVASKWILSQFSPPSYDLLADDRFLLSQIDDRHLKGQSQARIYREQGVIVLECDWRQSDYAWPFCGIRLTWDARKHGLSLIDLSDYQLMRIDARYRGQTLDNTASVRLLLLAEVDNAPANTSLKHQGFEFAPAVQGSEFPLAQMKLQDWWRLQNLQLSNDQLQPQLHNIRRFELITGQNIGPGRHHLELESIVFYGPLPWPAWLLSLALVLLWLPLGYWWLYTNLRRRLRQPNFASIRRATATLPGPHGVLLLRRSHSDSKTVRALLRTKDMLYPAEGGWLIILPSCSLAETQTLAYSLLARLPDSCIGASPWLADEQLQHAYSRALQALRTAMMLGNHQVIIANRDEESR